jgi:hypothetical protein
MEKNRILEIEEVGYPNSLIIREGAPIAELINTEDLVYDLFCLYQDYKAMYDDAYNHACEYQTRAHDAEKEIRELNRAYEGHDF